MERPPRDRGSAPSRPVLSTDPGTFDYDLPPSASPPDPFATQQERVAFNVLVVADAVREAAAAAADPAGVPETPPARESAECEPARSRRWSSSESEPE